MEVVLSRPVSVLAVGIHYSLSDWRSLCFRPFLLSVSAYCWIFGLLVRCAIVQRSWKRGISLLSVMLVHPAMSGFSHTALSEAVHLQSEVGDDRR